jgi:hypothetical protein
MHEYIFTCSAWGQKIEEKKINKNIGISFRYLWYWQFKIVLSKRGKIELKVKGGGMGAHLFFEPGSY